MRNTFLYDAVSLDTASNYSPSDEYCEGFRKRDLCLLNLIRSMTPVCEPKHRKPK